MFMSSPSPSFFDAFQNDKRSPSQACGLVPYSPGSANVVLNTFNSGLSQAGFSSLKAFVDACGKYCGNTIPSTSVPFPQDNAVKIDIGADHIGPSEIWVDDRLVMSNKGIDGGNNIVKTPPYTFVDFTKECPSGNCLVRFVMAALHNSPAEIYDSCVRITGASNAGSGSSSGPTPPPINPSPVSNNPAPESNNPTTENNNPTEPTNANPEAPNPDSWGQNPSSPPPASNGGTDPPVTPTAEPGKVVIITSYQPAAASPASNSFDPYAKEWSCGGQTMLLRSVNGLRYEIPCPIGTKCKTDGLPYAMCI